MVRSSADQVASCLHHRQWLEVQARSKHPLSLLHTKSVFVTGYALCLFLTSCDFPRPPPVCLPVAADEAAPRVTFRGRGRGRPPCVFPRLRTRPPPRVFPWLRTRPPPRVFPWPCPLVRVPLSAPGGTPRSSTNTMRGPVSRPPLYPLYGPDVTACRIRSPKLRCLPAPSDAVACSTGS